MVTKSRILIVGGNGFIGASLAEALLSLDNKVDILDIARSLSGAAVTLGLGGREGLRYFQGDVRDRTAFSQLPGNYDYVVHAAAILGIKKVCVEPIQTLAVNIDGTAHCLNYCLTLPALKRVLVFSTSEVYGPVAKESRESDDLIIAAEGMRWCYAASKIAGEQLTRAYAQQHNLPTVIVRPFNVYGPHRTGTNAVTTILLDLLMDRPVILSGSGKQSRAWCYIGDFVDGLIRCLGQPQATNQTFNLGNPHQIYSILDLALITRRLVGTTTPIVVSGSVEPDVQERSPNIQKAESLLGYNPKVSLERGLEATLRWHASGSADNVSSIAA